MKRSTLKPAIHRAGQERFSAVQLTKDRTASFFHDRKPGFRHLRNTARIDRKIMSIPQSVSTRSRDKPYTCIYRSIDAAARTSSPSVSRHNSPERIRTALCSVQRITSVITVSVIRAAAVSWKKPLRAYSTREPSSAPPSVRSRIAINRPYRAHRQVRSGITPAAGTAIPDAWFGFSV